jgi:hypothetical protein
VSTHERRITRRAPEHENGCAIGAELAAQRREFCARSDEAKFPVDFSETLLDVI